MKKIILVISVFICHHLKAQTISKVLLDEARPSALYSDVDEKKNVLLITHEAAAESYKIRLVAVNDDVKAILTIPSKTINNQKIDFNGIVQDKDYFYVFFKYPYDERIVIDVLIVAKNDLSIKKIPLVDLTMNKKDVLFESFTLKGKFYALLGNKKSDEIIFTQFSPTPDSLIKKEIKWQGFENAFSLFDNDYYISEFGKDNSVYNSWCANKIFERDQNKLLITSKNYSRKLSGAIYLFEFNFNSLTVEQKIYSDEKISTPAFINTSNNFVHGDKLYKMNLKDDEVIIYVFNLHDLSLIQKINLNKENIPDHMFGIWNESSKKDSSKLKDGKYIMKKLKTGSAVICANGDTSHPTLQIGTRIIESSGGGFYSSGTTSISTPGGNVSIPTSSFHYGGFSTAFVSYFTMPLSKGDAIHKSVYEAINDFVNNREDEFKRLENYPNNIVKTESGYFLCFLYKKYLYKVLF